MNKVYCLWVYEYNDKTKAPVIWSVHKTMNGGSKALKLTKWDGFVLEVPLRD